MTKALLIYRHANPIQNQDPAALPPLPNNPALTPAQEAQQLDLTKKLKTTFRSQVANWHQDIPVAQRQATIGRYVEAQKRRRGTWNRQEQKGMYRKVKSVKCNFQGKESFPEFLDRKRVSAERCTNHLKDGNLDANLSDKVLSGCLPSELAAAGEKIAPNPETLSWDEVKRQVGAAYTTIIYNGAADKTSCQGKVYHARADDDVDVT